MKRKVSDAKRKANDKYDKEHMKQKKFKFHIVNDADVIEMIEMQENSTDYIRRLVRKDIKSGD